MRPADLLAALGGRPRARLAVGAFAFAAAVDVVLLAGGVLLTRISTRSAVSRSVNRVATVARWVSRRASRSLIFVFSALIWSSIVGVVVGMVAISGFRSIGMINLAGGLTPQREIFNRRMRPLTSLGAGAILRPRPKSYNPRKKLVRGRRTTAGYWQSPSSGVYRVGRRPIANGSRPTIRDPRLRSVRPICTRAENVAEYLQREGFELPPERNFCLNKETGEHNTI